MKKFLKRGLLVAVLVEAGLAVAAMVDRHRKPIPLCRDLRYVTKFMSQLNSHDYLAEEAGK